MKKLFVLSGIVALLLSAIWLSGCDNTATSQITKNSNALSNNSVTNANAPVTTDAAKAFSVDFKSEPSEIKAGTPAMLSFTIKDRQGVTVKDLSIVHEKPMHLLIVSKDLAEFYHIHPEQQADGSYRVSHVFPNGGDYKLYADFTPKESTQIVERIDVKVSGAERERVALVPDHKLEKTVDGLRVVMKPSAEIKAGQELMLDFQAFDAKTNKPATDLQNYLGELAHFVIISEDMKDFVHAHPMSKGEHDEMNGMKMGDEKSDNHADDGHKHSTMEGTTTKPSESEVSAHTAFPRAGLYKLWAQFQRGGKVINVPFIVRVPESGDQPKAANNDSVPSDAIKITVSKNGYEPSEIKVEKGKPVKIAFTRADAENCGGEVVFSKFNITKKLPVGETVLVEFTPTEAGEIGFACGMGMMKGKVLVR
ncbi:MAG: cupredoxin domain-containing protein [Acidobacteria bacterium]|jgi:plastocyanin|nr:cupredoxin domain-containing protein [Acidobacteriota bacterium]